MTGPESGPESGPDGPLPPGPHPMPLHMANAQAMALGAPAAALALMQDDDLMWHPHVKAAAIPLRAACTGLDRSARARLTATVAARAQARLQAMLAGVARYQASRPTGPAHAATPLATVGGVTLLDHGPVDAPPVMLVPSMVNPARILDLMPGRSLVGWLREQGWRPLLVDWAGDRFEPDMTLARAVRQRLLPLLDRAVALAGGPVPLVGYCMGGTLSVAAAALAPERVSRLALLAAPWRFFMEDEAPASAVGGAAARRMSDLMASLPTGSGVPVALLQGFFAGIDPTLMARKFRRFANLAPDDPAVDFFVALESWANDGAPLPVDVAREVLRDWYGANAPARGTWSLDGAPVVPESFGGPVLIAAPARDRLVPPESVRALLDAFPHARTLAPASGHVGMIVGSGARAGLWSPLTTWLSAASPSD